MNAAALLGDQAELGKLKHEGALTTEQFELLKARTKNGLAQPSMGRSAEGTGSARLTCACKTSIGIVVQLGVDGVHRRIYEIKSEQIKKLRNAFFLLAKVRKAPSRKSCSLLQENKKCSLSPIFRFLTGHLFPVGIETSFI